MRISPSFVLSLSAALLFAASANSQAAAQNATPIEKVLHSFTGQPDGQNPVSGLLAGPKGSFFGVTTYGGTVNAGEVFQLIPPATPGGAWTENIIYNFQGAQDGMNPAGDLIAGSDGTLYGTTQGGGPAGANGTIFSLTPPSKAGGAWTETILYSFQGIPDGAFPTAGLLMDSTGAFYGTTYSGGTLNFGTVFKLSPPSAPGGAWTETILYSFQHRPDGQNPSATLAMDANGILYGTTYNGGGKSLGSIFSLTPPTSPGGAWTETILHNFAGTPDGRFPRAAMIPGPNGSFYGAVGVGGSKGFGAIFQLSPPASPGKNWTVKMLHNFLSAPNDGAVPVGTILLGSGGVLFGATNAGGTKRSGTVFQLAPPTGTGTTWTETILHSFTGKKGDGEGPQAGVVLGPNGWLYGTTAYGGTFEGTAYEIKF